MKNFDCIVVGAGITGSALSYELSKQGLKVLLLEKDPDYDNATRYSYGGVAYWSGTDDFSNKLCHCCGTLQLFGSSINQEGEPMNVS